MTKIDWPSESCRLLKRDPRISEVVTAPHVNGEQYSLVVAPDPVWLANEIRVAGDTNRRSLRNWEMVYDIAYRKSNASQNPDFAGWNDSFTGQPIPLKEMKDWLSAIAARALGLPHERVVEIGCGKGLLVQAIGPHCRFYVASDFSKVAVANLQAWLGTQLDLQHVEVFSNAAHDVVYPNEGADLIIINSVAQHFPDAAYLDHVVTDAWNGLRKGGHILIGDIRLLGALETFTYATTFAKASEDMRANELRQSVQAARLSQSELLVDPAYFHRFANRHGGTVRALLKSGRSACEMTRYRCDVIIGKPDGVIEGLYPTTLPNIAALHDWISSGKKGVVQILDLPNSRVKSDLSIRQIIERAADTLTVAEIRNIAARSDAETSADPADFEDLAKKHDLSYEIIAPPGARDCRFDVIIGHIDGRTTNARTQDSPPYTNSPLLTSLLSRLSLDLHKVLAEDIPVAHLPTRILVDTIIDQYCAVSKQSGELGSCLNA